MADYCAAIIRIGGYLPTVAKASELIDALEVEGLIGRDEDGRGVLLAAIDEQRPLGFEEDEVAGGMFDTVESTVRDIAGLVCTTAFDGKYEWDAGYRTVTEDGEVITAPRHDDEPAILVSLLEEFLGDPEQLQALIYDAKRAAGTEIPPLKASDKVLAFLRDQEEETEGPAASARTMQDLTPRFDIAAADGGECSWYIIAEEGDALAVKRGGEWRIYFETLIELRTEVGI